MPLEPGDTVGRYVIEARLGAGGMGEVYSARDPRLQRRVALKILLEEVDPPASLSGSRPNSTGVSRMLREARAAAALDHPNVVAIFDVGQVEAPGKLLGMTYLAMELIKGSSLRAYVGDVRVPVQERVRWLTDVARALAAAHEAGLVHRDIKPENVMIREDSHVKVLDFGIARRAHGFIDPARWTAEAALTTAEGTLGSGTPLYMAPEQLRADPLDGRADQFAWGVLAYELLTGLPPWSLSSGVVSLVSQILSGVPKPMEAVAPDVPAHVAAAVARALQKDAEARFASMRALIEALAGADGARTTLPPSQARPEALAPTERAASVRSVRPPLHLSVSTKGSVAYPATPARRGALAIVAAGVLVTGALVVAGLVSRVRAERHEAVAPPTIAAALAHAPECTTNRACVEAHSGEPWICRAEDHTCVSMRSEDCTVLAAPGDIEVESTAWIGMMLPLTGEEANAYMPPFQAAELARRDFVGTTGAVPNARRIGVVSCDGDRDSKRAARHLANDLHVPAVLLGIVGKTGGELVDIISSVFAPENVLTMLPHSSSPVLTSLPQGSAGRLVWRSTYSVLQLTDTDAALVEQQLEPQWRRRTHGATTRVAFLHPNDVVLRATSEHLLSVLRFNDKSVVENGNDFREVSYGEGADAASRARDEILEFRPSIVIDLYDGDFDSVIHPVETTWPTGIPRPLYVLGYAPYGGILSFIASSPERRHRFFSMDTVSATIPNAEFVSHYNETFPDKITRDTAPNNIYDGFYVLAYGIHALGAQPVTGPAIANAFRRLAGPGAPFSVGPHAIFDAYRELRSGATIDLEGAAGHLDLDPATGESTFDIAIFCAAPGEHGEPSRVASGLVYRQKEHRFTGTLSCP